MLDSSNNSVKPQAVLQGVRETLINIERLHCRKLHLHRRVSQRVSQVSGKKAEGPFRGWAWRTIGAEMSRCRNLRTFPGHKNRYGVLTGQGLGTWTKGSELLNDYESLAKS